MSKDFFLLRKLVQCALIGSVIFGFSPFHAQGDAGTAAEAPAAGISAPMAKSPGHDSNQTPLCFVPGTRGGGDFILYALPHQLQERGIQFIPMHVGSKGSIQQRARRLTEEVEKLLKKDPGFRCHFIGHSGGGLVLKFWLSHEVLASADGGNLAPEKVVETVTLLQAPMKGTDVGFFNKLSPFSVQAREQIDFSFINAFNDPQNTKTYSYWPKDVVVQNIRTWVESASEVNFPFAELLYAELKKSLCERGMNTVNDGVVSLENQDDGTPLLFDMRAPHTYFSAASAVTLSRTDFFTFLADFLHGGSSQDLETFKQKIRASGVEVHDHP